MHGTSAHLVFWQNQNKKPVGLKHSGDALDFGQSSHETKFKTKIPKQNLFVCLVFEQCLNIVLPLPGSSQCNGLM